MFSLVPETKMSFSRSEDDLGVFNEDKKRITVKSVARYALIFMLVAVMVSLCLEIHDT